MSSGSNPDYTQKQTSILSAAVASSSTFLAAVARLEQCAGLLEESGGNFLDPIFASGSFTYLDSYHANVLLQQATPGINAFLDSHVANDEGLPTYRELLLACVQSPV